MHLSDIPLQRLWNQRLSQPGLETPQQVVAWLGAVQAQDYGGAKWSVARRAHGLKDGDLDVALAQGSILRTHVLRPTWHFVAPADIRWLLALTGPRVHALNAYYYRQQELDKAVFKRCHAALTKALRGGNQLTRAQITTVLEKAGIAAARLRFAYIMIHAELEGLVVSGGLRGKQHTYALLEERVPPAPSLARPEALAELARRYFLSHGPATVKDFAGWASLTVADAQAGLEAVRPRLHRETVEGQAYWFAETAPPDAPAGPAAHLISIYDEYFIGYKDRTAIFDEAKLARLGTPARELFTLNSVLMLHGLVVGVWKRDLKKSEVLIQVRPFTPLNKTAQRAVARAAADYGEFLGRKAQLTIA